MTRNPIPLISTYLMLILPCDYKAKWKEKDSTISKLKTNLYLWRVADIRKSSGRVGELSYRGFEEVKNVTILEHYTPQKRWYKGLVTYTDKGIKNARPQIEKLYIYFDPWILDRLMSMAAKRH